MLLIILPKTSLIQTKVFSESFGDIANNQPILLECIEHFNLESVISKSCHYYGCGQPAILACWHWSLFALGWCFAGGGGGGDWHQMELAILNWTVPHLLSVSRLCSTTDS